MGSIRVRECARAGDRYSFVREFRNRRSQVHTALRQDDRSLYEILQFPDIARPEAVYNDAKSRSTPAGEGRLLVPVSGVVFLRPPAPTESASWPRS